MVVVQFPELDVDHIEVLVTEKICISVDIRLSIDILHTFQYF